MENNLKIDEFIKKVQSNKQNELDLSSDEDLSIAIMNLISIEEHFFFTGAKTGKPEYYDLLSTARAFLWLLYHTLSSLVYTCMKASGREK